MLGCQIENSQAKQMKSDNGWARIIIIKKKRERQI